MDSVTTIAALTGCSQESDNINNDTVAAAAGSDYVTCAGCHGANGQGNKSLGAPGLANLESAYIERQLMHFRDGIQGANPKDSRGAQMRAVVANLDDATISALAATVAAMDDFVPESTQKGNPEQGQDYYYHQCGACHGQAAQGNTALQAPKLAGLDDWYIDAQLEKFREGLRGSDQDDKLGAQMVFMMGKLTDDDKLRDIISYLRDPTDAY